MLQDLQLPLLCSKKKRASLKVRGPELAIFCKLHFSFTILFNLNNNCIMFLICLLLFCYFHAAPLLCAHEMLRTSTLELFYSTSFFECLAVLVSHEHKCACDSKILRVVHGPTQKVCRIACSPSRL